MLRQSGALYTTHPFILHTYIPLPPSQNTNTPLLSANEYCNTISSKTTFSPQEFQTLPLTIFTVLKLHADRSTLTSSPSNISGKQTMNSSFVSRLCPPTPAFVTYSDASYSDLVLIANSNFHCDYGGSQLWCAVSPLPLVHWPATSFLQSIAVCSTAVVDKW